MRTPHVVSLVVLSLFGCGGGVVAVSDPQDFEAETDAELTRAVRAELRGLTVSVKPVVTVRVTGSQRKWIVAGETNRDLDGAMSFVPDDAFGEATVTGPRTFEVAIAEGYELNSLLSGLRLLVNLTPRGATRPITAGIDLAPRFTSIRGSTRLSLAAEIRPVYASGGLRYRGQVRAPVGSQVSASTLDDVTIVVSARATLGVYGLDFTYDDLALALDVPGVNADQVEVLASEPGGRFRSKLAVVAATVKAVELTSADPYTVWPPTRCPTAVRTCLTATPIGATDFGDCGSYREVSVCGLPNQVTQLYPSPDDQTALQQALAALQVPAGKSVTFTAYGTSNTRNVPMELVAQGWKQTTNSPATVGATLTPGQVNTLLDGWNARSMVPAAQAVVYQQSFRAIRLDEPGATHVVLLFQSAFRMVVITLR
ncbi:MAG: hypothetical protein MUC96_37710 [Myxococcaceae bacterium]|jgi:hypothetical protein|nr:hypothetical protein [Myxococcaceae bacterium]